MKVLQINSVVNSGSTGRIAEDIGSVLIANGHESYIAYGRGIGLSKSKLVKIGNELDLYIHGARSLLTDRHGFGSRIATKKLIKKIIEIEPDLIALHNLHGYFLNIKILFEFLKEYNKPVVWTLFDCWAFTGHCTYFDDLDCELWKSQCNNCPKHFVYPASIVDQSLRNFNEKKELFQSIKKLEIIAHSEWLGNLVANSFLKASTIHITPSAIDIQCFKPISSELNQKYFLSASKIILGCASVWSKRKGLNDFIKLSSILPKGYQIVLIGLNNNQLKSLPKNILGIQRTESVEQLAQWYSAAFVFVNPTTQDNFPTTNIESLACGTPVITYNTGGSPEAIDEETGYVVEKGDVNGILQCINELESRDYNDVSYKCRERAVKYYNKDDRFRDYLTTFERVNSKYKNEL